MVISGLVIALTPILMGIANEYKKMVDAKYLKYTPLVILGAAVVIVYLFNSAANLNMNPALCAIVSILSMLSAVGAYKIAQAGIKISEEKTS